MKKTDGDLLNLQHQLAFGEFYYVRCYSDVDVKLQNQYMYFINTI